MTTLLPKPDPIPAVALADIRLAFYPECHHEVTRDGYAEPCERLAVAIRLDFNHSAEGQPYPVCARHVAKRAGHMVALLNVMGAKP